MEDHLAHYGVQGMKWGIRKPTQASIRAKYTKTMEKSAKFKERSDRYRYRSGRATSFTDFGVHRKERLSRKSDKYYYKSVKAARRGQKYIQQMEKKHPELFDMSMRDLLAYDTEMRKA